jgi:hypothetical protein
MNIKKPLFFLIAVTIVILLFSLLISGCGRRARLAAALEKKIQGEQSTGENLSEEHEDTGSIEEVEIEDIESDDIPGEDNQQIQEEENTEVAEPGEQPEEEIVDEGSPDDDVEAAEEEIEEIMEQDQQVEEAAQQPETLTESMPLIADESGNIAGGEVLHFPFIYIGEDVGGDKEVRGFISFDISGLSGATIEKAKISGSANNIKGRPFVHYGPIIIKSVNWGERALQPSDFDLEGVEIFNLDKKNFGITSSMLKSDLQNVVDSSRTRYQLMFYYEIAELLNEGQEDNITYGFSELSLEVTYIK